MASDDLLHRGATESLRFPMSGRCAFVHFLRESSQRKQQLSPEKLSSGSGALRGEREDQKAGLYQP